MLLAWSLYSEQKRKFVALVAIVAPVAIVSNVAEGDFYDL